MAISHNPKLVTENLRYYFDVNNKKVYPRDGYILVNNLTNNTVNLTGAFGGIIENEGDNYYIKNSTTNRIAGNLSASSVFDFTIQFWIRFRDDYQLGINSDHILSLTSLSSVVVTDELFFGGEQLTFEGNPLTISNFNNTPPPDLPSGFIFNVSRLGNRMGYINQSWSPTAFHTDIFDLSSTANEWFYFTAVKSASSISFYKNDSLSASNNFSSNAIDRQINLGGFFTTNKNYDINHIAFYDRALEYKEIKNNYDAFKNRYSIKPYVEPLPEA